MGVLAAAGAYAAAMAIVMFALPTINETPAPLRDATGAIVYEGFPADVLYYFRLYALGTQVVIYTTIGLVFGAMTSRLVADRQKNEQLTVAPDSRPCRRQRQGNKSNRSDFAVPRAEIFHKKANWRRRPGKQAAPSSRPTGLSAEPG